MAKSRSGRGYYNRGKYRFTPARQKALKRAQEISARKRRNSLIKRGATVGVLAGTVGTLAYLGVKNRDTIGRKASDWRKSVQPGNKEKVRTANAVSVAHPSQTVSAKITEGDRAVANATRQAIAKESQAPRYVERQFRTDVGTHVVVTSKLINEGGPDNRIYKEDNSVDTDAMVAESVARTQTRRSRQTHNSKARQAVTGTQTGSLRGTPGGTQAPKKAQQPRTGGSRGVSDADWASLLAQGPTDDGPIEPIMRSGNRSTNVATHTTSHSTAKATPVGARTGLTPEQLADRHAKRIESGTRFGGRSGKTWEDIVGKKVPNWSRMKRAEKNIVVEKGKKAGYSVDAKSGEVKKT